MKRNPEAALVVVIALAAFALPAQTTVVVPAAYANQEAPTADLYAFAPFPLRRQLVIDASHLVPLAGREITALAVRRNQGAADANDGGKVHLELWISHAATTAGRASDEFGTNRGAASRRVFGGNLDLPDCPAAPTTPAPWTAPYAIELPFAVPFDYRAGALCIESITTVAQNGTPPWWAVDAVLEDLGGTAAPIGTSCVATMPGTPAGADEGALAIGSWMTFFLRGPQRTGAVFFLLGASDRQWGSLPLPFELSPVGLPGCWLRNDLLLVAREDLQTLPQAEFGWTSFEARIPNDVVFGGKDLFGQWLVTAPDNPQQVLGLSNGVKATIGSRLSTLGIFALEATEAGAVRGRAMPGRAPVLRLRAST